MMTKSPRAQSWLRALAEAAKVRGVSLPSFTGHAMGGARTCASKVEFRGHHSPFHAEQKPKTRLDTAKRLGPRRSARGGDG